MAAAPAVLTNSRRFNPFRLVMDLPSTGSKKAGVGCRHATPDTRHLSQRVQHAQRVLVSRPDTRAPPSDRPEILEPERVAAGPEPDQPVGVVIQLAEQGDAVFLQVLRRVRLVHAVVEPQAPVGREVVTGLGPRAPAADPALLTRSNCVGSSPLRDVAELLSEVVAEIV